MKTVMHHLTNGYPTPSKRIPEDKPLKRASTAFSYSRTRRYQPHSARCSVIVAIVLALVMVIPLCSPASALTSQEEAFIRHPGYIPYLGNFTTPVVTPGSTGVINFTITNMYDDIGYKLKNENGEFVKDNDSKDVIEVVNETLFDVRLTTEIYRFATLEESRGVQDFGNRPEFDKRAGFEVGLGGSAVYQNWSEISPGQRERARYYISSDDNTLQGTYFIRLELYFEVKDGSNFTMKSRGHFTDEEWDNATTHEEYNPKKDQDDLDRIKNTGNIDLWALGNVSGIIPDTSFSVKSTMPLWPTYLLGIVTLSFVFLAIGVYLYEEKSYPAFNRQVNHFLRKYEAGKSRSMGKLGLSPKNTGDRKSVNSGKNGASESKQGDGDSLG